MYRALNMSSAIGLKAKILLPLALAMALFSVYMWAIWAPDYLGQEREDYLTHYIMQVDMLAKGLAPEIADDDLAEVYRVLAKVEKEYPLFLGITLKKESGEILYEYRSRDISARADMETIAHEINFKDGKGDISFLVDMNYDIDTDRERLNAPLQLLMAIMLALMIVIAIAFNRWFRTPLVRLSAATAAIRPAASPSG